MPSHAELAAFLSVAEHLNFHRAALTRGTTASAVSHAVRGLEREVGVRLLNRTTRSVALTEAGALLAARLRPALREIDQALEAVNGFRDTPQGTVRLNVPHSVGAAVLGPILARLARDYPRLAVEVAADDAIVDIVAAGFDAGIRFGERLQQDMIAVRLAASVTFAVVASPGFAAADGLPAHPRELERWRCIRYRFPSGALLPWEFAKDGQELAVSVQGPLGLDDQQLMIAAAAEGAGLAYVFLELAAPLIAQGRLVRCLEDWCPTLRDLFLYYPSRSHLPAGLRALIAACREGAAAG